MTSGKSYSFSEPQCPGNDRDTGPLGGLQEVSQRASLLWCPPSGQEAENGKSEDLCLLTGPPEPPWPRPALSQCQSVVTGPAPERRVARTRPNPCGPSGHTSGARLRSEGGALPTPPDGSATKGGGTRCAALGAQPCAPRGSGRGKALTVALPRGLGSGRRFLARGHAASLRWGLGSRGVFFPKLIALDT